jgi:4a-hydroxytetrahydrobiopterin dehydratase
VTAGVTPSQFHAAEGVGDWRVLFSGANAHFRTGSYGDAVALVGEIGRLATAAGHLPEVDLRSGGVFVRLWSPDADWGLAEADVELARAISAAARAAGATADPSAVQYVQLTVDVLTAPPVIAFWRAVLGYADMGPEDLIDPRGRGPSLWFQDMDAPRPQRNRIHVDLSLPHDQAEARIAAAVAAGGRVVFDKHAPAWWTLADPDGNEVDIATWQGRE